VKAQLDHTEDVAANIKTFWFRPEKPMRFVAGQFTELYLPHPNTDNRGDKHWFTISSIPSDGLIAITSKFAQERSSSFKQALWNLKPGAAVTLAEPMGDFVLPKDPSIPILYAATGIGVTPVHSMIRQLQHDGQQREITLLYGVRNSEDLAFKERFTTADIAFTPIVKQPDDSWSGETGPLDSSRILHALDGRTDTLVYLSGPEFWAEQTLAELTQAGIPTELLITDYFHGYNQV
jgi:ferredoxin-NADP reductase